MSEALQKERISKKEKFKQKLISFHWLERWNVQNVSNGGLNYVD